MITFTPMTRTRVETGNYYYGARYYDPKVSVWLSVDPWATKYPYVTPYNFVENNPLNLIDPDGNGPTGIPSNPKQMLFQGFTEILQAVGRAADNVIGTIKGWVSVSAETSSVSQTGLEASVTVEGKFEDWVTPDFTNNSPSVDNFLDIGFGVEFFEKTQVQVPTSNGTLGGEIKRNLSTGENSKKVSYGIGKSNNAQVFLEETTSSDGRGTTKVGVSAETEMNIGPIILNAGGENTHDIDKK